jgi:hypothetical protein
MKMRSIALLAAAVMVIAATGIGNVFAATYTYSGTDQSNNNDGALSWYSNAAGSPTVAKGDTLSWEDGFYNVGTYAYYAALVANGQTLSLSSQLGHYGYWWPNTASVTAPRISGDWSIDVQHFWSTDSSHFTNNKLYSHPYHVN